ncbi:hypothetical protein NDU88_002686 [Pleurodeles waltl]|uniref:Uncharacterized protein n=1 Tax=Pleurodeles waltl TaxID=8319 RepID=A0AAV7TMN0_PLEWA|nr:hypothetical protein NDU88_002686 [Pleurodeles waltl]
MCDGVQESAPDRTYPGGTYQAAGVEVKPLRHSASTAQGVGPQKPGRRREEEKERQREDGEEEVRGNEEKDKMKGKWGTGEEDEYGGNKTMTTMEEKTEN